MTNQEVFNIVYDGLTHQNHKAVDAKGMRRYIAEDGSKSPIGMLIPEQFYEARMETFSLKGLMLKYPFMNKRLHEVDGEFLTALQMVHDNHPPSKWGARLRSLAKIYGVKIPQPQQQRA